MKRAATNTLDTEPPNKCKRLAADEPTDSRLKYYFPGDGISSAYFKSKLPTKITLSPTSTGNEITAEFRRRVGPTTMELMARKLEFTFLLDGKLVRADQSFSTKSAAFVVMIRQQEIQDVTPDPVATRSAVATVTHTAFSGSDVLATAELHGDVPEEGITIRPRDPLGNEIMGVTLQLPCERSIQRKGSRPIEVKVLKGPSQITARGEAFKNVTGRNTR